MKGTRKQPFPKGRVSDFTHRVPLSWNSVRRFESRHQALLSRHGGAEGEACLSSKWPHDVAWWCASPSFFRGKKKLRVVEAWSMTWKLKHPYIQMVVSIGGFRIFTLKWMLQVPGKLSIESSSLVMKKPWPSKRDGEWKHDLFKGLI